MIAPAVAATSRIMVHSDAAAMAVDGSPRSEASDASAKRRNPSTANHPTCATRVIARNHFAARAASGMGAAHASAPSTTANRITHTDNASSMSPTSYHPAPQVSLK
jgi:hypothetical protein